MDMKKLCTGPVAAGLVALGGRSPPGFARLRLMCTTLLLLACIWGQGCSAVHVHVSPDPTAVSEVRQVMHRYLAAFNVDDFETIGASWHTPGWLSTSESRRPLKDREEVKGLYRALPWKDPGRRLRPLRAVERRHRVRQRRLRDLSDHLYALEERWKLHAAASPGKRLHAAQGGRAVGTQQCRA